MSHGDDEAHEPTALQTENVLNEIRKLEALRDQGVFTRKTISRAKKEFNRNPNCEPKQKKDLTVVIPSCKPRTIFTRQMAALERKLPSRSLIRKAIFAALMYLHLNPFENSSQLLTCSVG